MTQRLTRYLLFALKRDGAIQQYLPVPEASGPRIAPLGAGGPAAAIVADAATLYRIDAVSGRPFTCRRVQQGFQRERLGDVAVTRISGSGGLAYAVSSTHEVWRFSLELGAVKLREPGKNEPGVRSLTAIPQGCLIVKQDGSVAAQRVAPKALRQREGAISRRRRRRGRSAARQDDLVKRASARAAAAVRVSTPSFG